MQEGGLLPSLPWASPVWEPLDRLALTSQWAELGHGPRSRREAGDSLAFQRPPGDTGGMLTG